MKGLFITFEGTEGSGKSTQIALAAERLRRDGFSVLALREPGGTLIGESIRAVLKDPANAAMTPETELLLMNASRAQLVRERILPALDAGQIVLCDRFADSTVAYQAFGRGLDAASVDQVIQFATGGLVPRLTILLAAPVALSEARLRARSSDSPGAADRLEAAGQAFFERVEQGFERLAALAPDRVKRVDAAGSIEEVRARIWSEIATVLPPG